MAAPPRATLGRRAARTVAAHGAVAAGAHLERARPEPDQTEIQRLKALLTDPSKLVSTHHDGATGRIVMRVESRASGEVIEQIPSDKLLRLYAALRESLIDEQA